MKCDRCLEEVAKEDFPFDDNICENCCNEMLLSQPTVHDWGHWDFEKGDYKKTIRI